jgi:hypothetical protein
VFAVQGLALIGAEFLEDGLSVTRDYTLRPLQSALFQWSQSTSADSKYSALVSLPVYDTEARTNVCFVLQVKTADGQDMNARLGVAATVASPLLLQQ